MNINQSNEGLMISQRSLLLLLFFFFLKQFKISKLKIGFMTFKVLVQTVYCYIQVEDLYFLLFFFLRKVIKILNKNHNICDLNFI